MAERRENDAYYTPDDVARKCVATIAHHLSRARIVEPSVGGGAFLRAVAHFGVMPHSTYAIDVDPNAAGLMLADRFTVGDFASRGTTSACPDCRNWIIGNPPFSHALEHVERALEIAFADRTKPGGVAFLLRLAFVESEARRAFWRKWPVTELHILSKRPSFTGGKTDSCAYAFFVWHAGERQPVGWI